MSVYKEMSMIAAGSAVVSAVFIGQPWAFYVAATLGSLVNNPEGMEDSVKHWLGAVDDLLDLDKQLDALKKRLEDEGTWEGEAFKAFETAYTSFKSSLKQLKDGRTATGEGVGSHASFSKFTAGFSVAIATAMSALAGYKVGSKASPITAAIAEGVTATIGKITLTSVKKLLGRQIMVAGGLSFLLYSAIQASEMAGKVFPTLKAIPTEMSTMGNSGGMPFIQDGLEYNEDAGSLMPKMDESIQA
ncbi:hypothetical protein AB0G05_45665 [Nonomuraea wenchangensis]